MCVATAVQFPTTTGNVMNFLDAFLKYENPQNRSKLCHYGHIYRFSILIAAPAV